MEITKLVQWIKSLMQHNNIKAFYNCSEWEHLRAKVLEEQHCECQICKDKGLYSKAVTVHHIKHVRQHPEAALTKDNLLCVCKECHYKIHHRYERKPQLNEEKW